MSLAAQNMHEESRKRKLIDDEEDDAEADAKMLLAVAQDPNFDLEMPESASAPCQPDPAPNPGTLPGQLDALAGTLQRLLATASGRYHPSAAAERRRTKAVQSGPVIATLDATSCMDADAAHGCVLEIMRSNQTPRADWTHLWTDDGERGCTNASRIVDASTAAQMYTLASYDRSGMAFLERRVSNVARLALALPFDVHGADSEHELVARLVGCLDALVHRALVPDLRVEPLDRAVAVVLRPTEAGEICVHFPALAVSVEHMTDDWCRAMAEAADFPVGVALRPLNTVSRRPMFTDASTVWIAYDPVARCGHLNPVMWIASQSNRLSTYLFLGSSTPLAAGASPSMVERALPMLLSINPMGTPLFLSKHQTHSAQTLMGWTPEETGIDSNAKDSVVQKALSLNVYLRHLSPSRRLNPVLQNEVGMLLYAALASDQYQGFRLWLLWIHGHLNQTINQQTYCELLQQWRSFGHHNGCVSSTTHAEIRLHAMVEADCNAAQWSLFLNEMRSLDHESRQIARTNAADQVLRGPSEATLRTMGSMTHMDIARWAFHALRGRVCCSSTVGRGLWYLYSPEKHRWVFDRDGPNVLLEAFRIVRRHMLELCTKQQEMVTAASNASNAAVTEENNVPGRSGRTTTEPFGGRRTFPFVVNFPQDTNGSTLHQMIVVHLDQCIGDVRQIQAILRALAVMTHNADFTNQLDVCNEHVLPFGNGVLDMQEMRLRPGRPDDMVSRGPSYAYVDYRGDDDEVLQLERLLTTLFPDRELRQFILDFGATLLRKRNRFKHMYIFTGNTNGGKSLFMSLLNAAFETLYGVLPVTALTGRQNDPSSQNDYLARTHGMSFCVCHEPDSTTQQIYPDVMKVMTSDTDRLTVRGLYESVREMVITWKLGLVCNWPPVFVNLDNATRERCKFIPFASTFTDSAHPNISEQFRAQRFKADRSLTADRMAAYARTLMSMFFTTYVLRRMSLPTYVLHVPPRIHMEADVYLKEIYDFQMWVRGFFLPASMNSGEPMQHLVHEYLRQAMEVILF